jgi:hypothetical protein
MDAIRILFYMLTQLSIKWTGSSKNEIGMLWHAHLDRYCGDKRCRASVSPVSGKPDFAWGDKVMTGSSGAIGNVGTPSPLRRDELAGPCLTNFPNRSGPPRSVANEVDLGERHLLLHALGVGEVPDRILLRVGAVARHPVDRHDDLVAAQGRFGRGVEHGVCTCVPTVMTVRMP